MIERRKIASELRRRVEERKESLRSLSALTHFLWSKGISRGLAEEIAIEMMGEEEGARGLATLKSLLAARLRTCPGFPFEEGSRLHVALVGPTGVGKSVTLLKLASLYQGRKVGILALDSSKRSFLERFGVPVGGELGELSQCDTILIDTPGCNFYEPHRIDEIGELLAGLPLVQTHLVLSATTKEVDLFGAIHQFSSLDLRSLLFTKLDETLSAGVLINISARVAVPISHISFGYPLPGKIQIAHPEDIVHKILTDLNAEEFHFIRQINCQLNE